jgi:hypothetical protein
MSNTEFAWAISLAPDRQPAVAIRESVLSDFNGLRRHFGSREPRRFFSNPAVPSQRPAPRARERRMGTISFRASTKPKNSEKRNERLAIRNETKRMPCRKSLESLSSPNRSFRGIVCFQWVDHHFVSRFFTCRSRVVDEKCEAGRQAF